MGLDETAAFGNSPTTNSPSAVRKTTDGIWSARLPSPTIVGGMPFDTAAAVKVVPRSTPSRFATYPLGPHGDE